jgi:hypothetical protein
MNIMMLIDMLLYNPSLQSVIHSTILSGFDYLQPARDPASLVDGRM